MRLAVVPVVLLAIQSFATAAQESATDRAMSALQAGDLVSAETILRTQLASNAQDGAALQLLAVVLDQEKKYTDADAFYKTALALAPHSPQLLNNYGNHLLSTGQDARARQVFLQVLAVDPSHSNARVQLARLSLLANSASAANSYLDRLPAEVQQRFDVKVLRMQTYFALGRRNEADALFRQLSSSDPEQSVLVAKALSAVGQYSHAEDLFARALEAEPSNFEARYDLGLAASHAGHLERARDVLSKALELQPNNPDVLYDLAAVDIGLHQTETALELLAKAHTLAPQRTDIDAALARAAAGVGDFADAVQSWQAFLKLKPNDPTAQRESAFMQMAIGENGEEALRALHTYVRLHPRDAVGLYELGVAVASTEPGEANQLFDRAIDAEPNFVPARFARGLLLYRTGRASQAVLDFQSAARSQPENASVLDRLGECYAALGRLPEAIPLLRKAAALSPQNPTILLHLGHALQQSNLGSEAATVFAQYRELGPAKSELPQSAGFVEFLTLTPQEQQSRYRAGLERTLEQDPSNVEAQVRYLPLLLQAGNLGEANKTVASLEAAKPDVSLLRQATSELMTARQYGLARDLLQSCTSGTSMPPDLKVALAVAMFHTQGAGPALALMNGIPTSDRNAEYELALAEMLEERGDDRGAQSAIKLGLSANPADSQVCREAGFFLLLHDHFADAATVLTRCAKTAPTDPGAQIGRAVSLGLLHQNVRADFDRIEERWPEQQKAWIADALILELRQEHKAARQKLQQALQLSSTNLAAYLSLAAVDLNSTPQQLEAARKAADRAHSIDPSDPVVNKLFERVSSDSPQPVAPDELVSGTLASLFQ